MAIVCGICPNFLLPKEKVVRPPCGHMVHEKCFWTGKPELFEIIMATRHTKVGSIAASCFHTRCVHYHRSKPKNPYAKAETEAELKTKIKVITMPEIAPVQQPPEAQAPVVNANSNPAPVQPQPQALQPTVVSLVSIGVQTEEEPQAAQPPAQAPVQPQPQAAAPQEAPASQHHSPFWLTPLKVAIDIALVTTISFVALVIFQSFKAVLGTFVIGIFVVKMFVNPLLTRTLTVA